MQKHNIESLERFRHLYDTYRQVQVIGYLDQWQKDEILRVINEEFDPMYRPNLWCGPCVAEMLVKAFRHLDAYYAQQHTAGVEAVQEKLAQVALVEEVKEVKKKRGKKTDAAI